VAFDLRASFFTSQITLLHQAAHDGCLAVRKWLVRQWAALAEESSLSLLSHWLTAEVENRNGQNLLVWTFARGSYDPALARFFVK